MLEFGAEKGLFQNHARRWAILCLKKTQLPESLKQSPLIRKGERGRVSCCSLQVTVSSPFYKSPPRQMLFSVLTRKRLNFCPLRSRLWLRETRSQPGLVILPEGVRPAGSLDPLSSAQAQLQRQVSAGDILRAHSQILPSCHPWREPDDQI